jgi:ubiquitin carboxyl-terminal hydrolase 16/45
LYSLYGIVSHSGSLSGGHYVAYVRSRKPLEHLKTFFQQASFLDLSQLAGIVQETRSTSMCEQSSSLVTDDDVPSEEAAQAYQEELSSQSKWYYCSDSQVHRTDEGKVRGAEAYILFYERIY